MEQPLVQVLTPALGKVSLLQPVPAEQQLLLLLALLLVD